LTATESSSLRKRKFLSRSHHSGHSYSDISCTTNAVMVAYGWHWTYPGYHFYANNWKQYRRNRLWLHA